MADYNIYIHSDQNSNGIGSKTQPQEEQLGGVFSGATETFSYIKQFASGGAGGFISTGVAALSKVVPAVAVAVAVVKTTDKVLTTGFDHLESYTGHYEYSMYYNNFKNFTSMVINPVGTMLKGVNAIATQHKYNTRQAQVRSLLGETNKVGV